MTLTRDPHPKRTDVIILGAGAAGLMCAGVAGQRGRSVLLLEQAQILDGELPEDPAGFANRLNELVLRGLKP